MGEFSKKRRVDDLGGGGRLLHLESPAQISEDFHRMMLTGGRRTQDEMGDGAKPREPVLCVYVSVLSVLLGFST